MLGVVICPSPWMVTCIRPRLLRVRFHGGQPRTNLDPDPVVPPHDSLPALQERNSEDITNSHCFQVSNLRNFILIYPYLLRLFHLPGVCYNTMRCATSFRCSYLPCWLILESYFFFLNKIYCEFSWGFIYNKLFFIVMWNDLVWTAVRVT